MTGEQPSSKKGRTHATAEKPIVSVENSKVLWRKCELVSSTFDSRKRNGYKLQFALKSTENCPTPACSEAKPKVQISLLAVHNDHQLEWPLNGTAKIQFKRSQESDTDFVGDAFSFEFSIERPVSVRGPGEALPPSLAWTTVPEGCIPGEANYIPPSPVHVTDTHADIPPYIRNPPYIWNAPSIGTTIPDPLYVQVLKITHRKN